MSSSASLEITSRTDLHPPVEEGASVKLVRVSPDGKRLAFYRDDGVDAGVYVCDVGSVTIQRLVSLADADIDALAWSPTGEHLAYVTGNGLPIGTERFVGWAHSASEGEQGRVAGISFAWGAKKPALLVANLQKRVIEHVDVVSGARVDVGAILDDGSLDVPPSIAVPSDGKHVAFSCRSSYRELSEVWLLERVKDGTEPRLLTQIPGADVRVKLFWSPKGKSVAMSISHRTVDQSAIIVMHGLEGDGEVLHHHDGLDVAVTPAWSPDGRWIALFCRMESRRPRLALLDTKRRTLFPVADDIEPGAPHFINDRTLAIDGDDAAVLLTLGATG